MIIVAFAQIPALRTLIPQFLYYMISLSFFILVSIVSLKKSLVNTILFFLVFLFFFLLYYIGKESSLYPILISLKGVFSFFVYILLSFCVQAFCLHDKLVLLRFIFICTCFTCITSIIGLLQYPQASRYLSSRIEGVYDLYTSMNIGGYGFIYSLIFLIPIIVCLISNSAKKTLRCLFMVILVLFLSTILLSQYMLAILFSLAALLVSLFLVAKPHYKLLMFFVMTIFFIAVVSIGGIANVFLQASNFALKTENTFLVSRFVELSNIFSGNGLDGDAASRSMLYSASFNTFMSNPFLGNSVGNGNIGGHSTFLDVLAATGIVGFSLYLFLIFWNFKMFFKEPLKTSKVFIFLIILFFFLSLINTVLFEQVGLSLFLPMVLIDKKIGKKKFAEVS